MIIEIDASDFARYADNLEAEAVKLLDGVKGVVSKGALKVKTSMRADMAASGHFAQAASRISYDTRAGAGWAEAEIGPAKGGPGDIANIAYFGGVHGGGGTVRDPQENLDEEAPFFEAALEKLLGP